MSASVRKQYCLKDWLALHGLSVIKVRDFLFHQQANSVVGNVKVDDKQACLTLTANDGWELAAEALSLKFPMLKREIDTVKKGCEVNFYASKKDPPYTLDRGDDFPYVSVCYRGYTSDLICIAHEFGHAVQLFLSAGKFLPPVLRELAAFISELALIECLRDLNSEMTAYLVASWSQENKVYLTDNVRKLELVLKDEKSPYDYCWNYPIARYCAIALSDSLPVVQLEEVFRGLWSVEKCVNAACDKKDVLAMRNYLPEVPALDKEKPALNAYRSLGMMALLDIDYWQGESEKRIEDYYAGLLGHLQKRSSMIAINDVKKPIGYVAWEIDSDKPEVINLTRQAAPFGDHLEVLKKLKQRLPDDAVVISKHMRSSRKEQSVW
ncbi:hypothetical protein DKW60_18105 [Leucothrix pacifica]|uniref:Peptidase M3A/M3B catalytic domain-containing protein n=1 Tax=Leucothrix pacifica TaxID=1247513 RepID=A0A317C4M7_9GAMM|nr:hypothetical protein DKW60_18105 [Leucothrix pacifica]